ncbi:MAG: OPT family oligopeptide transporter, partial [Planctomycetota bacterium]
QKDRWWFENVWKGNMPQLTLRSALTGFFLGGILSATNLYVGAKTGWTLGVGITSVILAFAMFKVLGRIGMKEITLLENNCMQSIATAAGYMTAPMISSIGAYMLVTNQILETHVIMIWIICIALLGVLFAFPMKRRFINDEQHPFPEGRACGVVMDTLHTSAGAEGMIKVKALIYSGVAAMLLKLSQAEAIMEFVQQKLLGFKNTIVFHENLDVYYYALVEKLGWGWAEPKLAGVALQQFTIRPSLDVAMFGAGGLMGIRTGVSLLIGATINYFILAPIMIQHGDIFGTVNAGGELVFGFRRITEWALWGGVSLMVLASLVAFFAKPQLIFGALTSLFGRKQQKSDVLKHIELPMWVFVVGIPIVGGVSVYLAHLWFGVEYWLGIIAIPLVFVFSLIGAHSTALTSITPTGALGKLTQLTYGALAPGNIKTNLMTAGITGEAASNVSNLLMDIKPGYMLGGKPRHQAIGHCIGIVAGALASVPLFNILFLQNGLDNMVSEEFPMPAVAIWKGVAEILTQGLDKLPQTAMYAAIIGAVVGIVLEVIRIVMKGKFPLTPVGIGLAFVIPFNTCLIMFLGAFVFWAFSRRYPDKESRGHKLWVDNHEPICAGIIAGAALMGVADAVVLAFFL